LDLHGGIVEAQKSRIDLFKWKLILVAGLGAAASGLIGTGHFQHPGFLLALIPLVSLYVDLLCLDQTLRIVVVARYFQLLFDAGKKHDDNTGDYEAFVAQATSMPSAFCQTAKKAFSRLTRENWIKEPISAYGFFAIAQYLSTVLFALGALVWVHVLTSNWADLWIVKTTAFLGGGLGTLLIYLAYTNRFSAVQNLKCLSERKVARQ
jgi:hypothetical protein